MCELKSEGFFTMADKQKALDTALVQIEKQYGKGAIMRLGQNNGMNVASIPTGSISLDVATGIGGLPRGRIIEIYGPESSGKTTLALHVIAQAQKAGGEAAFIDAEHALDPIYAENLGVDVDSLLVSQPDTGEQALDITDALVRSGAIDVDLFQKIVAGAVIDSRVEAWMMARLGAGIDHPLLMTHPEGEYLKGLYLLSRGRV